MTAAVHKYRYQLKFQYSVYNSVLKKVAQQGIVGGEAVLSNYSKKPSIGNVWLHNQLTEGLLSQVISRVCYKRPEVERMIYASKGEDKYSRMLDSGVDQAVDERWEAASKKWQTVARLQKTNSFD